MRYSSPTATVTLSPDKALGRDLNELEERFAPSVLHLAGDLALLAAEHRVSIVGSRKASEAGRRRARRLARELAQVGCVIVSGLAEGIDRAAHEGALEAGGKTIAVLGTPLTRAYPAKHAPLQEQIYREHLLVSEFGAEARVHRSNFIKRNRTMALLSTASVIAEAADGSGTLSQAAETQRLGRPLYLMRNVAENAALEWPERFLMAGANVLVSSLQITE